jgi:hypothetical protein
MNKEPRVGSVDIHDVTKESTECRVREHDHFATIQINLGITSVTLYTTIGEVAAIRRILGGW